MKSVFGALGLLIVLALVGFVMVRQTRALSASRAVLPAAGASVPGVAPLSPRVTEQQVTRDIDAAMQAASAARARAADQ